MWNKIMPRIPLLIIMFLISGCNAFDKSYATLEHVYSIDGDNYYSLSLRKQTHELVLTRELEPVFVAHSFSFDLAKKPVGRTVFPLSELTFDTYPPITANQQKYSFVSGQIIIDLNTRLVMVSLATTNGDFPGNGKYFLKYIHMPEGCPEPDVVTQLQKRR